MAAWHTLLLPAQQGRYRQKSRGHGNVFRLLIHLPGLMTRVISITSRSLSILFTAQYSSSPTSLVVTQATHSLQQFPFASTTVSICEHQVITLLSTTVSICLHHCNPPLYLDSDYYSVSVLEPPSSPPFIYPRKPTVEPSTTRLRLLLKCLSHMN